MNRLNVVVFGGTGLIGSHVVGRLVTNNANVIVPVRREPDRPDGKTPGVEYVRVDFSSLTGASQYFAGSDFVYCLGTTHKQAGSAQKFREIEIGIAKNVFEAAKQNGVKRLFLLSSSGAASSARGNYLRVKGEIENLARQMGFETLVIFKPSLLIGKRSERRPLEKVFQDLSKPILPVLQRVMSGVAPVRAEQVAKAIVSAVQSNSVGQYIVENDAIIRQSLP